MRYGYDEISSSFFSWTVALVVALFVVSYIIIMGPNKATRLTWGQWDLNLGGKWGQYFF